MGYAFHAKEDDREDEDEEAGLVILIEQRGRAHA